MLFTFHRLTTLNLSGCALCYLGFQISQLSSLQVLAQHISVWCTHQPATCCAQPCAAPSADHCCHVQREAPNCGPTRMHARIHALVPTPAVIWLSCSGPPLQSLNVSRNQLGSLPFEIGDLPALTSLDLSHNQLRSVPHHIGNLSSLTGG